MLTIEQVTATSSQCNVCEGRSTWDFLHDFYFRVEVARSYARSLENELYDARSLLHQSQNALGQCEASLQASCDDLNEERLEHRASREELTFERERHNETHVMLEKVFREAVRSGEVADLLRSKLTSLRAVSDVGDIQEAPALPTSLQADSLSREYPTPPEASASITTEPVVSPMPTPAECLPESIGLHEDETQITTLPDHESVADWRTQSRATMISDATTTLRSPSEGAASPKKNKPVTKRKIKSQGRIKRLA